MRVRAGWGAVLSSLALGAFAAVPGSPSEVSAQVRHGGHVHDEPAFVEDGQYRDGGRWRLGAGLGLLSPTGEFGRFVGTGFAANAHAVVGLEPSNTLALRLDAGFGNYGRERISFGGFPGPASLSTNHNVATFGVGPQIQLATGPIQPYVNGFVGLGYFFTTTSYSDPWVHGSILDFDDMALGYGAGGGIGIALGARSPVRLTLDVQYRRHDDVEYLREGGIIDDGFGAPIVTPILSDANFLTFQFGASFGF